MSAFNLGQKFKKMISCNTTPFCVKLAAKRLKAQDTDSVLSPELSPVCLKTGSIRRNSSRRRRSHRPLSEETAEEAAEEKFDPLDEPMVHHPFSQSLVFL